MMIPKIPREPLIFAAGVALGSLVTWLATKETYKSKAQEEIDSVKEVYARINQEAIDKAAAAKNKPDIATYVNNHYNYPPEATTASSSDHETTTIPYNELPDEDEDYYEEPIIEGRIYEISPAEFASYSNDNSRITLIRFEDDIYVDEHYDRVDPRDYFDKLLVLQDRSDPVEPLNYIRRMSKDEICIRNTELKLDIDVVTEGRTYKDFMST